VASPTAREAPLIATSAAYGRVALSAIPAATDAFNIASVAHTGVGTYLITFTNALDSANFQVAYSKQGKADFPTFDTKTTTSVTLFNFNSAGTAAGKNR
jgi:hypothetical protein